jgi:transcriptional regulator with XRE-family HTH domain
MSRDLILLNSMEVLARNLRILRRANNFTQEYVAGKAEIGFANYNKLENCKRKDVLLSTVEKLASVYGCNSYKLLEIPLYRVVAELPDEATPEPKSNPTSAVTPTLPRAPKRARSRSRRRN